MPSSAYALYTGSASHLGWGNPTSGAVVPVCYTPAFANQPFSHPESPANNLTAFLGIIRNAVESTWQRAANIRFTGWGPCQMVACAWASQTLCPPNGTLALDYIPGRPNYSAHTGFRSDGATNVYLGFDDMLIETFEHTAVHEFGHALGFKHEYNRADNFAYQYPWYSCGIPLPTNPAHSPPNIFLTDYDPQSIMNYCGENYRLTDFEYDPTRFDLSAGDVRGAIKAYGKKPSGIYVYNGKPLSKSLPNQSGGFPSLTEQMYFWSGVTASRQQWIMSGNLCVSTNGSQGDTLWLMNCVGSGSFDENQRWDIEPSGRIRRSGTNLCVTIQGSPNTPQNPLTLSPCQSTLAANEIFSFYPYEVRFGSKCVYSNAGLTLNDCTPAGPSVNQGGMDLGYSVYFFRGKLTTPDGQCITTGGPIASSPWIFGGPSEQRYSWYTAPCSTLVKTQTFDTWK